MAGFLTNLGLAAGRSILYGQEFQERQAELDLRKQQVEMGKLALGNAQRQQQTQAEVGSFLQSEMQKDAANFTDPANAAKEYSKAAGIALTNGDFVSANTMTELAKGKAIEARDEAVAQQKQLQLKKEDLSNTAADYQSNPTAEGGQDLVRKAIAAGVNPATIPANLQSPAGRKWVNDQQMASMSGKERMNFLEKVSKDQQDRAEKQREFNIRQQDLQENRRFRAMMQEAMLQDKKEARAERGDRMGRPIEIGGSLYERDPSMTIKGDRDTNDPALVKIGEKLTAQERTGRSRGSYAAAEVTRSLTKALEFSPGTTTGPFAGLGAHTGFEAVLKVGAQALTPAQMQSMEVNAAGLGNQIASLEAALGGRMAAGTQQTHLQDMAVPKPGDSGYTALYKFANAKELTITALEHLPGGYAKTEAGKAQIEELQKSVPFTTSDVIGWMQKDPKGSKTEKEIRQLAKDSAIAKDNVARAAPSIGTAGGVGFPGQGGGGSGQVNLPPLPSGFTLDK